MQHTQQNDLWWRRGKALMGRLRDQLSSPPTAIQPSVWYSGLGIEPHEFCEQLVRLQTSLNSANGNAPRAFPPSAGVAARPAAGR